MKKLICLLLVLLLLAVPVCAAEIQWDNMTPADNWAALEREEDVQVQLPTISEPELYESPAVEVSTEYPDDLAGLLQKQIDVTSGVNVWLGMIAGLLFIKILFDRIRVV